MAQEGKDKDAVTPVVVETKKAEITVMSLLTQKTTVSINVGGRARVFNLVPQQRVKLPDTHAVRSQLVRYVNSNTLKIV